MSRGVRYRVLRKIAHGGMAEIFLALQVGAEGFEKPVVLKRILPALGTDPSFVRMLVDEAHIVSSLNHTHLVQILDLGKADGQFFLVLEFVDGWSLEQVRRRARKARLKFPLPLALYITSALCRGLDYVHRRERNGKPLGIVHRDVTPQNVLLGREGDVKLADFGIAKAIGRREKSATGVIKGKFAYMSPEQTVGAELDARSDLFSVGTLLYLLTTGQKPFDGPTDLDVLMQVRKARHEKPSTLVRDFNPDVERFIERALRPDRSKRWQSAEQMADRLDNILIELGKPASPAALRRWLTSLSARDGIRPPGDLIDAPLEPNSGTIQLGSSDLELQHLFPPRVVDDDDDHQTLWAATRAGTQLGAVNERIPTMARVDGAVTSGAENLEPATVLEPSVTPPISLESVKKTPNETSPADDPTVFRDTRGVLPPATPAPSEVVRVEQARPVGEPPAREPAPEQTQQVELAEEDDRSGTLADAVHFASDDEDLSDVALARDEALRQVQTSAALEDARLDEPDDRGDDIIEEPPPEEPLEFEEGERANDLDDEEHEERSDDISVELEETTHKRDREQLQSAFLSEAGTATALSLPPPARPTRRGTPLLVRLGLMLVLLPVALGAGAYVARPYFPSLGVPQGIVDLVDHWIERLPRSLEIDGVRTETPLSQGR
jgi:eukaryotic-like serine/threonine-protein kinase